MLFYRAQVWDVDPRSRNWYLAKAVRAINNARECTSFNVITGDFGIMQDVLTLSATQFPPRVMRIPQGTEG